MANVLATAFTYLGGQFQIGNAGSPESFTTITQVQDVDFSGSKVDTVDVTDANNTDGVRRFKDTLFDPGDCSVSILWNPNDATHIQLLSAFRTRGQWDFTVVNPGGFGTRTFSGIITSLDLKEQLDKPTTASVKIKISGAIAGF